MPRVHCARRVCELSHFARSVPHLAKAFARFSLPEFRVVAPAMVEKVEGNAFDSVALLSGRGRHFFVDNV